MAWNGIIEGGILMWVILLIVVMGTFLLLAPTTIQAEGTIVEDWASVKSPSPVELKSVTVNPKETAFLILDIEKRTCNSQRRPRCIASVPKIEAFLKSSPEQRHARHI